MPSEHQQRNADSGKDARGDTSKLQNILSTHTRTLGPILHLKYVGVKFSLAWLTIDIL